jgi:hypothetical protein
MKNDKHKKQENDHSNESAEHVSGNTGLTTEHRPAETHNAVSTPDGGGAGENKVATSLDD